MFSGVIGSGLVTTGVAALLAEAAAYWKMNSTSVLFQDTAGTTPVVNDGDPVAHATDSNGGNNATQGTASAQPVWRPGDKAVEFDGVDSLRPPLNAPLQITGAITIALWIYDHTGGNSCITKGRSRGPIGSRSYDLFDNGTNFSWVGDSGGAVAWNVPASSRPTLNTWHFIVGTFDGTTNANGAKLYIDGDLDAQSTSSSATVKSGTEWNIGGALTDSFAWDGLLSDVAVYKNRVLTAAEVTLLFNNTGPNA